MVEEWPQPRGETLPGMQGRLICHCGGHPSPAQNALINRLAWLQAHLALMDEKMMLNGVLSDFGQSSTWHGQTASAACCRPWAWKCHRRNCSRRSACLPTISPEARRQHLSLAASFAAEKQQPTQQHPARAE